MSPVFRNIYSEQLLSEFIEREKQNRAANFFPREFAFFMPRLESSIG